MERVNPLRAGALNQQIRLIREIETVAESGAVGKQWGILGEVRAEVLKSETAEADTRYGEELSGATTFRIRYLEDLTVLDRVIWGLGLYEITTLEEIGRRRGLEVSTVLLSKNSVPTIGELPVIEEGHDLAKALYMASTNW